jgi:hypothetical protein
MARQKKTLRKRYGHAPARRTHFMRVLAEQEWIEPFAEADTCLFEELLAAYVARGRAQAEGATEKDLAHGDEAINSIKRGDVKGQAVWRRAAVAIRRFGEALGKARMTR